MQHVSSSGTSTQKPYKGKQNKNLKGSSFIITLCVMLTFIHSFISIQPWRPGLAGTRAQSCDRYGSGTLHPGQGLGGSLPLLSPAFRRSHFSRNDARDPSSERWNCGRERCPVVILPEFRLPRKFRDLLHAANLRHGTDGFTSPPKDFFRPKNPTASAGFEPANLGTKGQHATTRPP